MGDHIQIGEVARILGVSQHRVKTLVAHRLLPVAKRDPRGHLYFLLSDVLRYRNRGSLEIPNRYVCPRQPCLAAYMKAMEDSAIRILTIKTYGEAECSYCPGQAQWVVVTF